MASVNVKPAATGRYSHHYMPVSVVSLDFSELVATRVMECNIGDEFNKFSGKGFLRLAPQIFPAYGRCQLKSAGFFVPEYQLLEQSEAIHSNMNMFKGKSVVIPHFKSQDINYAFTAYATQVISTPTPNASVGGFPSMDQYDFVYVHDSSTSPGQAVYEAYKLNKTGQNLYKLLKTLGYDFASYQSNPSGTMTLADATAYNVDVNALPILAYLKIYADMFLNTNRYNDSLLVEFLHHVHDTEDYLNMGQTIYNSSTGVLDFTFVLGTLLLGARCPHQHNMYLDSWNTPNSPSGVTPNNTLLSANPDGVLSPYIYSKPFGNQQSRVSASVDGTLLQAFNSSGQQTSINDFSQFGLRIFNAFVKFVSRNNLFGNKAVQRVFARFGVKSDDYKSHYVHKLFEGASDIDFSAIMSNTDNYDSVNDSGKTLGAYAGFGVAGLNFDFNYKCSEFGYIIVLSWLQIVPIKMRGFNPSVLRMNPFDWYTPEYDGETIRAIPMMELSVSKNCRDNSTNTNGDTKVFGFTNLYDEYREQQDMVAGDFVVSKNGKDFLFARDYSYFRQASNASVMKPQTDALQYWDMRGNPDVSNPFQLDYLLGDRFYFQINFDIQAVRHIKSKSDVLDLNGSGDLDLNLGGVEMS